MRFCFKIVPGPVGFLLLCLSGPSTALAQAPVPVQTNVNVRIMAANLTDNDQTYEPYAIRIFQGLKPDVVAIQEFNYSNNTATAFSNFVGTAFGTNFVYFREGGYSIPNGVISRYPVMTNSSWVDSDTGVNDRGFAWAQIDIPGTNDLYVVSVHLKASGGLGSAEATRRDAEAAEVKSMIQSHFPPNAWVVVAGDLNIGDSAEPALARFKTFLSDFPIPTDTNTVTGGDADTNRSRGERYDYVLPSFNLSSNQVPVVIGSKAYTNGLVFDSRKFTPLSDVAPVLSNDSTNAQHIAVVKDFRVTYTVTNIVTVPPPVLEMLSTALIRWQGLSNLTYTVQTSLNLSNWTTAGSAFSSTTNFFFTNAVPAINSRFFRVTYP